MLYILRTRYLTPFLICAIVGFTFDAVAQNAVEKAINALSNAPSMQYGTLGFCVLNPQTGDVVASRNSTKALIPASTLKTVTTATSLAIFGKNHRFETYLEYDGDLLNDGTLKGNLYLRGTGDPMLGSNEVEADEQPKVKSLAGLMSDLVAAVQAKGIRKIEGFVIGDDTFFGTTQTHADTWQWADIGNYYGAGATALNLHENLYYLYFHRSKKLGDRTTIHKVEPAMPYLTFTNEVTQAAEGTGDNAYFYGAPYTYHRYIRGTVPVGDAPFKVKGSIPDPAFFAAFQLVEALENAGIQTSKQAITQLERLREGTATNAKRTLIYTHQSPTLAEIVARANEWSVNLYCEALLKAMGKKKKDVGTTEAGVETVLDFWKSRGVDVEGFFMQDGSGLSPRNGISAFTMATILSKIAKDDQLFPTFYEALPLGGQNGTVKAMFKKNKKAGGRVHLKSGSISRVRAYCGYAKTQSGKLLAFSIIANNFTGSSSDIRQAMEEIILAIAEMP